MNRRAKGEEKGKRSARRKSMIRLDDGQGGEGKRKEKKGRTDQNHV